MNDFSQCPTHGDIGLMILLITAGRRSETLLDAALASAELTFMKWRTLDLLVRSNTPMSMKSLVEALGCVKSNVTPLIDKLEAGGIVVRLGDPEDRRSVLVELTDAGRLLHKAGLDALESATCGLFGRFDTDNKAALRDLLGLFGAPA